MSWNRCRIKRFRVIIICTCVDRTSLCVCVCVSLSLSFGTHSLTFIQSLTLYGSDVALEIKRPKCELTGSTVLRPHQSGCRESVWTVCSAETRSASAKVMSDWDSSYSQFGCPFLPCFNLLLSTVVPYIIQYIICVNI